MRAIAMGLFAAMLSSAALAQTVHSLDATEARQGVASDGIHAYAIDNSRIGKYDLKTGKRIAAWEGEPALFPHMNACTLFERKLICAASNFPKVPMTSAIEIFDPVAMKHLSTISLGMGIGSLTWVSRKDGFWWAGFANYAGRGGEPALFPHMNACTLFERKLICAASNFPKVPMTSAIEIFDPMAMKHLSTISLGVGIGSLTWVSHKDGFWWAGFANYAGRGGEPGRDNRYTAIVKFDDQWRKIEGFTLPDTVLERMAPMSTSGGGWGDDGLLYVTGHDRPEVYALRLPKAGSTLELVATLPIPFEGQAIDWDPRQKRLLWGISRKDRKAIAVTIPPVSSNVSR